jgi:hypothetical protein
LLFREKQALAVRNHVVIAGKDFSFNTDDGCTARHPFQAGYSANVYVVTLPFTTTMFRYEVDRLASASGCIFTKTRPAGEEVVYSYRAVNPPYMVELAMTTQGGLKTYTHQSGVHSFIIRFAPPLIWRADEHQEPGAYSMSLGNFSDLVCGQLQRRSEGKRLLLTWRHTSPHWAQSHAFQSVITVEGDGSYQLAVSPLRID